MNWYLKVIKSYAVFNGRAGRPEFWYSLLAHFVVVFLLSFAQAVLGNTDQTLTKIYSLLLFLPMLAVSVRRLHDTDRSGWWVLLGIIPVIGIIILFYWYASAGTAGDNRFGTVPPSTPSN